MNSTDILQFWFGKDQNAIKNQELWFKISAKTDALITEKFSSLLTAAEQNELNWSSNSNKDLLAKVILLSQFTRFIHRGSVKMFQNDTQATKIANELIATEMSDLTSIEKYFVYLTLLNCEDITSAANGLVGVEKLYNSADHSQKEQFSKFLKTQNDYFEVLKKFGRFPHRNTLLKRESTKEELKFLLIKRHQPLYRRSLLSPTLSEPKKVQQQQPRPKKVSNLPFQNLLFLHGFRQNSNKIKKRLKNLITYLKNECNTHVTFLNGTHPYQEIKSTIDTPSMALKNPIESQRVWYNPNADSSIYHGIDESYAHIMSHIKSRPPYDGIIGFSQGGVLAAMVVKRNPEMIRYFISISSYKPKCLKYAKMFSSDTPFNYPSLHIYGREDEMVTFDRSIEFSKCFSNSKAALHDFGHFAPDVWPVEAIAEFVTEQSKNIKPPEFSKELDLQSNIQKFNLAILRFNFNDLNLDNLLDSQEAKDLLHSNTFAQFFNENPNYQNFLDLVSVQDQCLLAYFLMVKSDANTMLMTELWTSILEAGKNDLPRIQADISRFFVETHHWKELVGVCDVAKQRGLEELYEYIIEVCVNRILVDLAILDKQSRFENRLQEWTSLHKKDPELVETHAKIRKGMKGVDDGCLIVSNLASNLPRIKNAVDKRSRIGREIANKLNEYKSEADPEALNLAKMLSYNRYRKVCSELTKFCKKSDTFEDPRQYSFLARHDKSTMERLMKAPLSDSIVNPVPEPVDFASREQMQPLYDWLEDGEKIGWISNYTDEDIKFIKGTLTTDGRLDLCKQVIGPQGIEPLLESMKSSKKVDRVLLGNNIIGDKGGQVIANFIKSGKSPIKIWYIAGNHLTSVGIEPITEALKENTQVNALWLKRNPLKMPGMVPISNLLAHNHTIQVLDLLNCGLLDNGVEVLCKGLASNNTLKHLYLSANGITVEGLTYIKDYYSKGKSSLQTLFLGCNRIGNEGAKIVADILRYDSCLERLNLASSRIGATGMKHLSEALIENKNIKVLDLGYMKATMDLGELGNYIEDEGAEYLADFIAVSTKLVNLCVTHNHITEYGMYKLSDSIGKSESLVQFDYVQYGVSLNSIDVDILKRTLDKNRENYEKHELDEVLIPAHVREIYSVYRTH